MAKKDQFIIAYLTDLTDTDTVVSHASFFAQRLEKGLILLHISDPRYTKVTPDEAERELNRLCETQAFKHSSNQALKHSNIQAFKHSSIQAFKHSSIQAITYAALSGDSKQILSSLPTLMNAVLVVAQVDAKAGFRSPLNRRNVLRDFADCRAAFLTVQKSLNTTASVNSHFSAEARELDERIFNFQLNDVAMVVDFKKESKDKFIWSSYFPRFIGSRMHVLYLDYKDQFLHSKWYANMQQLHKLYSGLDISFQPHIIGSKSTKSHERTKLFDSQFNDTEALRFAHEQGYGLLICVTTKERDTLEFFIGTQELRTITNRYHIPILFLNPREDLYVLCD